MKKYSYDIVAFGELLIDFTDMGYGADGQKLFARNPGGAPANGMVCATKFGSSTAFLGKVGQDMHGGYLKDTLAKEGINIDGLIQDPSVFTTLAFVALNERGERSFSFSRQPGADTQMHPEELSLDIIQSSRIFHVGSLSLTHEPSRSATHYGLEKAREAGCIISYDPNYRASLWSDEATAKAEMRSILPDIMKISDEETYLLTDHIGYQQSAQSLFQRGVKVIVVTLGKDGCYVHNREGGQVVSGFHSEVVDTTGAGDAFWGAFLHKVAESQQTPEELTLAQLSTFARFANAAASLCVEHNGGIPAMPSLEEVQLRLSRGDEDGLDLMTQCG